MKALHVARPGPPDVITVVDLPEPPSPGPTQVLVDVARMSINGADHKTLAGWFPNTPFPRGLGREFSGIVREVGSDVATLIKGQHVLGAVEPAMQESVLVDQSSVTAIPEGVSFDVAACLPVAGQTAWEAVKSQGVHPGEVCVVSGASGGVGSIITQLLIDKGATVVALARPKHHERLEAMGAIPVAWTDRLAQEIERYTPHGIHHVFDQVGIPVIEAALELGVPRSHINSVSGFGDMLGVPTVGRVGLNEITIEALGQMIRRGQLTIPTFAFPFDGDNVANAFLAQRVGSYFGKTLLSTALLDGSALGQE